MRLRSLRRTYHRVWRSLKLFLRSSAALQARPGKSDEVTYKSGRLPPCGRRALGHTKDVAQSRIVLQGIMRRFSVLLSLPKERVETVIGVHGNVEVWSECARCARCLVRLWGGLYWRAIASDTTEYTNGIRSARTKGGQHDGTARVASCFCLYSD